MLSGNINGNIPTAGTRDFTVAFESPFDYVTNLIYAVTRTWHVNGDASVTSLNVEILSVTRTSFILRCSHKVSTNLNFTMTCLYGRM